MSPLPPQDPIESLTGKLAKLTPTLIVADQNKTGIADQFPYPVLTDKDCLKASDQVLSISSV